MPAALDSEGKKTGRQLIFCSVALLGASFLPTFTGVTGLLYLTAAIFSGTLFVTFAWYLATHRFVYAKQFIPASIFYLAVLNIFLLMDKV